MAHTEAYITHGAAASDLNGGAPLGTDDGPVCTRSNCDATGAGPYSIEDKDSTGWAGVQVGDFGRWDTAGAQQLFRVTELNYGGDADVIRVVAVGSSFTTANGKAVRIGGAWASVNGALAKLESTYQDASANPARLNVKADSAYTGDAGSAFAGTEAVPLTMQGYTATPGDGGEAELQLTLTANHNNWRLADLYINRAAIGDAVALTSSGNGLVLLRVRARSSGAGNHAFNLTGASPISVGCRAVGSGGNGFYLTGATPTFAHCVALSAGTNGFAVTAGARLLACVAHGAASAGYALTDSGNAWLWHCIAHSNTGDGLYVAVSTAQRMLIVGNSIFWGNGGYGIQQSADEGAVLLHCALGTNTSGDLANLNTRWSEGQIALSGDPLVDAAGGDFRLDPRTAAGQQLLAAGFVGALTGGLTDIGALAAELAAGRGLLTGGGL